MQQTHAVLGELAHYGSEPFNYRPSSGLQMDNYSVNLLWLKKLCVSDCDVAVNSRNPHGSV